MAISRHSGPYYWKGEFPVQRCACSPDYFEQARVLANRMTVFPCRSRIQCQTTVRNTRSRMQEPRRASCTEGSYRGIPEARWNAWNNTGTRNNYGGMGTHSTEITSPIGKRAYFWREKFHCFNSLCNSSSAASRRQRVLGVQSVQGWTILRVKRTQSTPVLTLCTVPSS